MFQARLIPSPLRVQVPPPQPLTITMPLNTTTPVHRVTRILREGARLIAVQHGQASIDVTPDIIAMLDGVQSGSNRIGLKKSKRMQRNADDVRNF